MTAFIKRLWAAAPFATALLALALAATLVFGLRAALFWADRHERIAREQPVAAWMTPGYVAHSWHLPREVVAEALAIDRNAKPPRAPLAEIAAARGVPVEALIAALEAAIAAHRAAHPPPGGDEDRIEAPAGEPGSDQGPEAPAAPSDGGGTGQ